MATWYGKANIREQSTYVFAARHPHVSPSPCVVGLRNKTFEPQIFESIGIILAILKIMLVLRSINRFFIQVVVVFCSPFALRLVPFSAGLVEMMEKFSSISIKERVACWISLSKVRKFSKEIPFVRVPSLTVQSSDQGTKFQRSELIFVSLVKRRECMRVDIRFGSCTIFSKSEDPFGIIISLLLPCEVDTFVRLDFIHTGPESGLIESV